jgi:hypothetical protein
MRKTPRTDAVWERFRTDTTGELSLMLNLVH